MTAGAGVTLTVLGCDGSHPGPGGAGSGYLVRHWASATALWLDAGPGTFAALQQYTDPTRLAAVVLTHCHRDHWSDVADFLVAARWTMTMAGPPVPVYAAPGIRQELGVDLEGIVAWHEVGDGDDARVGPMALRFSRTDHPPETFAVRVEADGGVLGYSADSGPRWPLTALGTDLDLVLCEATYTAAHENDEAGHMSGRQAGRAAREARCRRLVLTHRWAKIPADVLRREAEEAFGGPVEQAEPGRGFSL
ncbi:MAG TPA: MBL fold metallo-hydrolase [Acidimicrobiales bacterium]|nr:MBL fold metallo-hydrolase [Acidimicrobiales bacterium]